MQIVQAILAADRPIILGDPDVQKCLDHVIHEQAVASWAHLGAQRNVFNAISDFSCVYLSVRSKSMDGPLRCPSNRCVASFRDVHIARPS